MVEDVRKRSDGSLLRPVLDLPSIGASDTSYTLPHEIERLYQAHISFVVTGMNNLIWVAYAFVDVVEREDTVKHYDIKAKELGIPPDPLACSRIPMEAKSLSPPKQYFLNVFCIRIQKVKYEWHFIVHRLQNDVKRYVPVLVSVATLLLLIHCTLHRGQGFHPLPPLFRNILQAITS